MQAAAVRGGRQSKPEFGLGSRGRRWRHASLLLALSASCMAAATTPARAAEASVDATKRAEDRKSLAKARYEEGVEAYRGARYADAVRLFLEADALSPSAALSYNIARAYEKLADDAQTLRWYRDYLRRDPQAKNAAEVQGFVLTLSRALAKVGLQQVTVLTSPSGATVAIDGTPLGVSPLTVELRPGKHSSLVSRRGYADVSGTFELEPATPLDLSVPLPPATQERPADREATHEAHRRFGVAPYLTLGAAAVCLSGAGIFELARRSAQSAAREEQVQVDYERDIDAMNSRQTTSRVLLGVGGVLAAAGATLWVFNTPLPEESRARVAGVPGGAALSWEQPF